ncbi:hypothetical protein [Sphingomonas sp. Y38-1Y]|uniref:hypothetical protein n=1 Tax=Sphingomonas sp. Y38-1Y TaxID=3078265 RepID=UPI0028EC1B9B|nr:hypothetical protein [Sphingomonas sp. Y38-1Y]
MTSAPVFPIVNRIALILFALALALVTAIVAHDLIQVARGCAPGDTDCQLRMHHYRSSISLGAWVAWLWAVVALWWALSRRVAARGRASWWLAIFWLPPLVLAAYALDLAF